MRITDDKRLLEVQEEFQKKFPYLKIEFYAGRHGAGEGSRAEEKLDPELTIGDVRSRHKEGELQIEETLEVRALEKSFYDDYGLNVQVFRQSGNLWMQTSASDHWTLETQNRKGGHSAAIVKDQS